jgi:spermidine synthase
MTAAPASAESTPAASSGHLLLLGALFFISGAAALIYQVLWVRELGLLFGATAEAAALTIAIFFSGVALGGYVFGRIAARSGNPLKLFGLVEIGVAVTALGHFLVADAYFALYPALYAQFGHAPVLETAMKALVATTILLPPAFLMGGTLPLMGQHLIRSREALGRLGSALYAVNTLGGATGALVAGFALPMMLGFKGSYLLAVGMDLMVGLSALVMAASSRKAAGRPLPAQPGNPLAASSGRQAIAPVIWAVAFLSGFATLAIEVIWTRLFAQVLQNSVYTYALVLTTFLAALALGAVLANLLARLRRPGPGILLPLLLAGCAIIAAATPHLFHGVTDGLSYLGRGRDFAGYVQDVAMTAAIVMLVPGIILGAVLPYLLRAMQSRAGAPGEALGRLIAANTAGAILGALAAGFLLLPLFGSYRALWLIGALYALLAVAAIIALPTGSRALRLGFAGTGALAALILSVQTPDLAATRINPARGENLVDFREGRAAHVSVVARNNHHFIRVNNYYTLGGSGALWSERNQALIPLLTHNDPRSVFFLGMGTGITAGASLFTPVERVLVCEILPDVVDLAKMHFRPYVNGLFDDPRVEIHAEDGRHCLARSPERFDAIIADLFTPWKAGTGNLYTREHYAMAATRLNPGGIYVQWMPLYQISREELAVIGATMQAVFPQVTMWRGDLYSQRSIVALVGSMEPQALDPDTILDRADALTGGLRDEAYLDGMVMRFYAGNVSESGIFHDAPINSDNVPLIEYMSPRTHRAVITGDAEFLVGKARDALYDDLTGLLPPDADPHLARLTRSQRDQIEAGRLVARSRGLRARGDEAGADAVWQEFLALTPPVAHRVTSPANEAALGLARFAPTQ